MPSGCWNLHGTGAVSVEYIMILRSAELIEQTSLFSV